MLVTQTLWLAMVGRIITPRQIHQRGNNPAIAQRDELTLRSYGSSDPVRDCSDHGLIQQVRQRDALNTLNCIKTLPGNQGGTMPHADNGITTPARQYNPHPTRLLQNTWSHGLNELLDTMNTRALLATTYHVGSDVDRAGTSGGIPLKPGQHLASASQLMNTTGLHTNQPSSLAVHAAD